MMFMVVITILYLKKVACDFLCPFMDSATFVLPKKPTSFTASPTHKSVLFAKIYNSVDTDKRRSEKYLFENANFHTIPNSRNHRCCKIETFSTKKA